MDLLSRLDVSVLLLSALSGALIFSFIPAWWRLRLGLLLLGPWLTLGMLQDLGGAYQISKMTETLLFGWIAMAAWLLPAQKRPLPWLAWGYPLIGLAGIGFVVTTDDWPIAIALKLQWVALALAALGVARIADRAALRTLITDLTLGCAAAQMLVASALVADPTAFRAGLGRMFPFGANPNHIGLLFAMTVPLALWCAQHRGWLLRAVLLASASLGLGLGLLTGSRSVMLCMTFLLLPIFWHYRRRPLALTLSALFAIAGGAALYAHSDEATPTHLEEVDTDRVQIAEYYLTHPIADRPLGGLLGTTGQSALMDTEAGTHPHNGYLELLYVGGACYALPVVLLLLVAIRRAWRVFLAAPEDLWSAFALAALGAIAAHGMVNGALYYPTYPWAFLHVLLVGLIAPEPGVSAAKVAAAA